MSALPNEIDLIGLAVDGMEPTLLGEWIDAGELPNLANLREEGTFGTAHCSSTSSASQWTTHFTGVSPETHGVDGFLTSDKKRSAGDRAPDAEELINLSNIRTKTYPELLVENGKTVGLVNPLPIWPPLELDSGFCISGMLTPPSTDRWIYPNEMEEEVAEFEYQIDIRYGDRPYGFVDDDLFGEVSLDRMYDDMFAVLEARIAFTKHAIENHELDYLYVLLKEIDAIQHVFWAHMEEDHPEYGDAILEAYRLVDDLVGWIREHGDANLLVFSDHGFQQRRKGPPSGVDTLAQNVADVLPVPKLAKEFYRLLTQSPIETESDGTEVSSTTGVHDNPAVWMLEGPGVNSSEEQHIDFEDIPPTILALLDEPIPEDYVGTPISSIKPTAEYNSQSLSVNRNLTIEDREIITERLHNLGYAEMVDEN